MPHPQQNLIPPEVPSPKTKEESLAWDLAIGLSDMKGLHLYIAYAKKYPEDLLRQTMADVKEIPEDQIKKSRGALFNYLIQQHAIRTQHQEHHPFHSRD